MVISLTRPQVLEVVNCAANDLFFKGMFFTNTRLANFIVNLYDEKLF